ncbi:hypothetical protein AQUCO_01600337v1 [Aquilegia coerulea]|uniref:Uncharacterized protein n=1 Tax=Aquilegia coerulea TaxID=218851 RepID=A0A2G5DRD9_AQUCA|nr:hypothetical protein AQUCO_01600337v1 [Aquilegia coerulea]
MWCLSLYVFAAEDCLSWRVCSLEAGLVSQNFRYIVTEGVETGRKKKRLGMKPSGRVKMGGSFADICCGLFAQPRNLSGMYISVMEGWRFYRSVFFVRCSLTSIVLSQLNE